MPHYQEDPSTPAARAAYARRERGEDQPGIVTLRDFDQGVVETLGAHIIDQRYWLVMPNVEAPPGKPGVLVTFSFPESEFKSYVLPVIMIRRDDIAPANERWHSYHETYATPAKTSQRVKLPTDNTVHSGKAGYDRREIGLQAVPFDITYTISILSHYRGALGQRAQVQNVLHHVLRTYAPYSRVIVKDSLGDLRLYFAFMEGTSVLDDHPEISERVIGFGVTLRVEAELDLFDPQVVRTVTKPLTLTLKQL